MAAVRDGIGIGIGRRWLDERRASLAAAELNASRLVSPALAGITAAGFVLRVAGMDQSLYGDEHYTFNIVTHHGVRGVWHQVYATSITPPLHYYLAWLAVQFGGDKTILVRLPSLILGTAAIPLLFLIARRIGGVGVGLIAAALLALSPFALFYSTEARAYETVVFLITVSMLSLLKASEGDGRRWWVIYVLSSCAAIWAHYTSVFVLSVEGAWALWTQAGRRRQVLAAQAAIVLLYMPWLPGYLHQRHNPGVAQYTRYSLVSIGSVFDFLLRTLVAHPFVGTARVPGRLGWLLVLGVAVLLLGAMAARRVPTARVSLVPLARDFTSFARSERGLIVGLAAGTPVGLLLYALVGPTLFASDRELSASEPALIVLVAMLMGLLVKTAPARVALPTLAGMAAVLSVIAVQSTGARNQRPPYREVARYIDVVAPPSAPVIESPLVMDGDTRVGPLSVSLYLRRSHPVYRYGVGDSAVWQAERGSTPVYFIKSRQQPVLHALGLDTAPRTLLARIDELGGPDGRAIVTSTKTFPGFYSLVAQRYQGVVTGQLVRRGGRELVSWTLGHDVVVSRGFAVGAVTGITSSRFPLLIAGWGVVARSHRPVDWFLFFSGERLFAVSPGGNEMKAVAARYGPQGLRSGFAAEFPGAPRDHSAIRVFAVAGHRASELPLSPAARAEAR